ncbi:uncharacterized protein EI97DRAFT_484086 [Westerdykella ornata]|uniref:Uncharacterized protein n=1 Tax=Westerdykella ornata TaxID=318751 RepID=A0A6A6J745_WESOR|nr:uncharacterized protein EI97DRAFT_484086 [Westerdykella ornata]KAF2272401.1 hypothetical protein EI97DRAFT_484086 [Westerdykella ornata]
MMRPYCRLNAWHAERLCSCGRSHCLVGEVALIDNNASSTAMALDLSTVSFVGSAMKLAWEVYDKGFKKEKSSPQRYIEFGSALHGLYSNLKNIESVVTKANNDLKSDELGSFGPPALDLSSFADIIGNFKVTLEACRDLLNDQSKFRQKNGVITNIIYNIDVDPNKITLTLEPFKLHLQSQLRKLQRQQHQDVAEMVHELKQLVVTGLDLKDEPLSPAPPRDLEVPVVISERFAAACGLQGQDAAATENSMFPDFPLKEGLEAFFYHFNGLSQAFDSMSYLRFLKILWVMDRIRESNDWTKIQKTNPGGIYDRCVREMDRRLRDECTRVNRSQIPLKLLLQLPDEAFHILPPATPTNTAVSVNHLGVLLDVSVLPDPNSHTLRIVRNMDGTLGVESTTVTTTESSGTMSSETRIRVLDIDPRSAYFIPIYATPVEDGSASLTAKLQFSRDGVNGIAPEFKSKDDLLRLQHLVTGYKCVNKRTAGTFITVTSLTEGQSYPWPQAQVRSSRRPPKELCEFGNIQMWQKVSFESTSALKDKKPSDHTRRVSELSGHTARPSIGSSMSFSSAGSMSSAHMHQVTVGSSGVGIQLTEPEPPRLVLFLKEKEQGLLSFLAIELDERTFVNPFSCECGSRGKTCTVSVIERSEKPLLARRYYAREGLNSWNLAALGEYWPADDSGAFQEGVAAHQVQ